MDWVKDGGEKPSSKVSPCLIDGRWVEGWRSVESPSTARKLSHPLMDREPQGRSVNAIRLHRSWAVGFEHRLSSLGFPPGRIIYDGAKLYWDTQFWLLSDVTFPAPQPLSSAPIDDARRGWRSAHSDSIRRFYRNINDLYEGYKYFSYNSIESFDLAIYMYICN